MANQKYTGMKILRLLLWLLVLSMADTINYTPATTATQFSNVGDYPIAVTLEIILTIVLFQLMVFLSNSKSIAVTVIADGKSKVYGDENPALTAVVTGAQ
jgi:hypothetical protein